MRYRIKLNAGQVKDFVQAASRCSFDIDVSYNSFIVDAKSIVGVLGLNLQNVLTVTCSGYDSDFDRHLKQYAAAC